MKEIASYLDDDVKTHSLVRADNLLSMEQRT